MESTLLLRVEEAAALAAIGRSKAYELIDIGEWRPFVVKIGRSTRVLRRGLEDWVEARVAEQARDRAGAR